MRKAYETLNNIRQRWIAGEDVDIEREVLNLLSQHGIRPRQHDGKLEYTISSIPTSVEDALVLGLRYMKKDGTHTEDHFLLRKNVDPGQPEIDPYYRGMLESKLPEYRGTHKQQVTVDSPTEQEGPITLVNTIVYSPSKK